MYSFVICEITREVKENKQRFAHIWKLKRDDGINYGYKQKGTDVRRQSGHVGKEPKFFEMVINGDLKGVNVNEYDVNK